MRVLGMMHIKAESQRFPQKYHREFKPGQTVFDCTLDSLIYAGNLTDLLVCTDDKKIKQKCREHTLIAILHQTPFDEKNTTKTVRNDMIPDTIRRWRAIEDYAEPIAWIGSHGLVVYHQVIRTAVERLLNTDKGTVQTVERVDHHHPHYLFEADGEVGLVPYETHPASYKPSQQFHPLFAGTGACFGGFDPPRVGPITPIFLEPGDASELHYEHDLLAIKGIHRGL
jgi:CMP-N-acetylneuraminic acid synthetase